MYLKQDTLIEAFLNMVDEHGENGIVFIEGEGKEDFVSHKKMQLKSL